MFTDMTGFSRKMGDSERLTLKLLGDHNRIIRFLVRKHHGKIIKSTGDGFLLDFDSAVEAVVCAVEAQERFQRYNLNKPECEQIWVRVGINLGEVKIVESDLFGDEVNIAARIQTLAEAGGICISRDVYDQVKNKLSIVAVNLGPQELKNIRHKIEIYKVLVRALGQEAIEIPSKDMAAVPANVNELPAQSFNGQPRNLLNRILFLKKNALAPATQASRKPAWKPGEKNKRAAQPNRNPKWALKFVSLAAFTLILPTIWLVSKPETNELTASWASLAQAGAPSLPFKAAETTIAVLYFENRTQDARDNWMSIGLADMLITDLEQNTSFHILGRAKLMDILKTLGKENAEAMDLALARLVAEQAKADIMLLGSFVREGNIIRIDTQLYDVRRGEMLLAEKAQGESVFGMVDELTRHLKKKLLPALQTVS
jgi:class 3 adenylate cyclase/TolB-like protein